MFNKILFSAILFFVSNCALAANYTVAGSWTDPTPADPEYTAAYDAEWRVNAGATTAINGLASPNFSTTVAANPGDNIEARVRARNTQGGINGNWTIWFTATAPNLSVTPADQTGVVITVVPQ